MLRPLLRLVVEMPSLERLGPRTRGRALVAPDAATGLAVGARESDPEAMRARNEMLLPARRT